MTVRAMVKEDYDGVRALWMTIHGFGIRSVDDSREGVERFLDRNPGCSVVAEEDGKIVGPYSADMTAGAAVSIMCALRKTTVCAASVRRWSYTA